MLEKRHSVSRQDGEELKQAVNTRQVFTKLTESPLSCISIPGYSNPAELFKGYSIHSRQKVINSDLLFF